MVVNLIWSDESERLFRIDGKFRVIAPEDRSAATVMSRGLDAEVGPTLVSIADEVDAPTLNTSLKSHHLFKVLTVEVFKLRCISTVVETQPNFKKRASILNRVQTGVSHEF